LTDPVTPIRNPFTLRCRDSKPCNPRKDRKNPDIQHLLIRNPIINRCYSTTTARNLISLSNDALKKRVHNLEAQRPKI